MLYLLQNNGNLRKEKPLSLEPKSHAFNYPAVFSVLLKAGKLPSCSGKLTTSQFTYLATRFCTSCDDINPLTVVGRGGGPWQNVFLAQWIWAEICPGHAEIHPVRPCQFCSNSIFPRSGDPERTQKYLLLLKVHSKNLKVTLQNSGCFSRDG